MTKVALGGRATRRAVTRVKPEQASKVKLWMPTHLSLGEGRVEWGSNRPMHPFRSTGVMGTARWESERIQIRPAVYRPATKRIMTEAASERLVVIPAKYGWVTDASWSSLKVKS